MAQRRGKGRAAGGKREGKARKLKGTGSSGGKGQSLPVKHARKEKPKLTPETARNRNRPKSLTRNSNKLPKTPRPKPPKTTTTTKASSTRKSAKPVPGRLKRAPPAHGSRKQSAGAAKGTKRTSRTATVAKAAAKPRTGVIRRRRLHANMRFFSNGQAVRADVTRRTAAIIGSYLAAVRRLLDANDIEPLEPFVGKSVRDVRGRFFPLETRPNVLYRLNAAVETFEEVYRLIA